MLFVLAATCQARAQSPAPVRDDSRTLLVEVRVNGRPVGDAWQVVRSNGDFFATAEAFAAWRLRVPDGAAVRMQGRAVHPLREPLRAMFDAATQTLSIDAPAGAFVASVVGDVEAALASPERPSPGAFLNYDFHGARDRTTSTVSGVVEMGIFNNLGVFTTTVLARDITAHGKPVRLQSAFTRDDPATATTLRVGDSIGAPSSWGRRPYFGGVQWGSNFSTRPEMVLLPLPSLHGEAVQPSFVDIYVNNVLAARREVPAGPFTLSQVPIVSGAGEVRMVVRDVLGREQAASLSYYLSPALLRSGLHEFSWEAGAQRRNLGLVSNDYGPWFASTSHRYGWSDRLTVDGRFEASKDRVAAGAGAMFVVGDLGTVGGGVAGSTDRDGNGLRGHAEFQRVARRWSIGARVEGASRGFRQIGMAPEERAAAFSTQAFGSLSLPYRQALSAGFASVKYRGDRADVRLATLGYSVELMSGLSLSLSAFRSLLDERAWGANLTASYALGGRRFVAAGLSRTRGGSEESLQLQQGLPADTGFGYDVRARGGDAPSAGARLLYQNPYGNYEAEVAGSRGALSLAASVAGGIVTMGGHTMLSRTVQDGFAVVEAPGAAGVDIYSNNQRVATTNSAGVGLVPSLLAYQRNVVRLDERGLAAEVELDLAERTVSPYARSGVLVTFAARRNDGATLRIVTEDHAWMPLGAEVRMDGSAEAYLVAQRGEVFVREISYPATIQATTAGRTCSFVVPPPPNGEPLPRLGPFRCRASPG